MTIVPAVRFQRVEGPESIDARVVVGPRSCDLTMPERPSLPRHWTATLLVGAVLATGASMWAAAGAEEANELRGEIPSGDEVREELDRIAHARTEFVGSLAGLEGDLAAAIEARDALGVEGRRLAAEIEATSAKARELAVSAFVTGNPVGDFRYLLNVDEAADLSWRQYLIKYHASSTDRLIERLAELPAQADEDIIEAVDKAERLRLELALVELELAILAEAESSATRMLLIADAWDRAEVAIAEGPYGFAPIERWEALRFCESTHDYRAISPSGAYRGAYQFDFGTWKTIGGTGDPAAAPPAEQDARARELYARRGDQPWPVCGRFLRDDDG